MSEQNKDAEFVGVITADCPECGEPDEELGLLPCCGVYFCHDCFYRHLDKYALPEE